MSSERRVREKMAEVSGLLGQDEAPEATDADRSWREILLAAAAQGAIVAAVRAVLDRGAAIGAHRLTGTWPGDEDK